MINGVPIFIVNGNDLSAYVKRSKLAPMPNGHRSSTYGGRGLILEVEGSYDCSETRLPDEILRPLDGKTVSIDIGDNEFAYEPEMTLDGFFDTRPVCDQVLWSATFLGRKPL